MKKLLGIIVLGLLLSGCASGPPPADYGEAKGKKILKNFISNEKFNRAIS